MIESGWIDKLDVVMETLGAEEAAAEICRAIGSIEAENALDYIIRMWGMDDSEEE